MFSYWWLAIRPKTLLASVGPIVLGTALASGQVTINQMLFMATLICALALQVAVNLANDLFDGLSGVDSKTRLGPIRVVQAGLISVVAIKRALFVVCAIAVGTGIYLVFQGGWEIFVLGVLSLMGVFAYSAGPFPLASKALGEVTVLVFFGWIAVLGSFYLQTQTLSFITFGFATSSGLFSAAIMLVNNIRDIGSDKAAGKITLAVLLGAKKARIGYSLSIISALVIHLAITLQVADPLWIALLICLPPSYWLITAIFKQEGVALNNLLARTAQLGFVYNLSVALLWLVGR